MKRYPALTAALAVVIMFMAFAGSAFANGGGDQSQPPAAQLPSTVTLSFLGSSAHASASDVASGKVTVLQDEVARFKRTTNRSNCIKVRGGFWNSGEASNGRLYWFWDPAPATLCRNKKSPTGWVKVAGGKTGRACYNAAKPKGKAPGKVVKGRIILVRSFKAKVQIRAKATANAVCSTGLSGASASASAQASVKLSLRNYLRSKGAASVKLYAKVQTRASASASAQVNCTSGSVTTTIVVPVPPVVPPTPPTPPKPPKPPVVQPPSVTNVTSPEEIYADGETYPNICATVSAKNGNSVTVNFGANFGSFTQSSFTFKSNGTDKVCTTYVGPNDDTAVGHDDQITVTVHDNTTGLNGQSASSMPFPIKSAPANPV